MAGLCFCFDYVFRHLTSFFKHVIRNLLLHLKYTKYRIDYVSLFKIVYLTKSTEFIIQLVVDIVPYTLLYVVLWHKCERNSHNFHIMHVLEVGELLLDEFLV